LDQKRSSVNSRQLANVRECVSASFIKAFKDVLGILNGREVHTPAGTPQLGHHLASHSTAAMRLPAFEEVQVLSLP
jgi:hypothetical protein